MSANLSYTGRIKNTYSWNFISNILTFASLIIASSFISTNEQLFSIYSIVFSLFYLIGYFDFGFTSAALKFYSAQSQNNTHSSVEILGFIFFIFLVLGLVFALMFAYLAFSDLASSTYQGEGLSFFKSLMGICSLFTLTIAFKKVSDVYFTSLVKTYIQHQIISIGAIFKLLACVYFFIINDYLVYQYFFTFLLIELIVNLYIFSIVIKNLGSLRAFFETVRFNSKAFKTQYKLASTTVLGAFVAIICYENDVLMTQFFVGSDLIYLVAAVFFLVSPIKKAINILFIPLFPRLNHFYGHHKHKNVEALFLSSVEVLSVISPFFALGILLSPDIIFLVYGIDYLDSRWLLNIALFAFLLSLIKYPIISYLRTYLKVKTLMYITVFDLIIFLVVFFFSIQEYGVYSIFIAKVFSSSATLVLLIISLESIAIKTLKLVSKLFLSFSATLFLFIMMANLMQDNDLASFYLESSFLKIFLIFLSLTFGIMINLIKKNIIKRFLDNYNKAAS